MAAYDGLRRKPGASRELFASAKAAGALDKVAVLGAAMEEAVSQTGLATGAAERSAANPGPQSPGPAKVDPGSTPVRGTTAPNAKPATSESPTALEQYEQLLASNPRKAGLFYADNRDQIVRDLADRYEHFGQLRAEGNQNWSNPPDQKRWNQVGPMEPLPTKPAGPKPAPDSWKTPNTDPLTDPHKVPARAALAALETYQELLASDPRAAGEYFTAHREEILKQQDRFARETQKRFSYANPEI